MLLAFDLDGTLVTAEGVLPEPLLVALQRAQARHHVTVLTGRNHRSAERFIRAITPTCAYATCQGSRLHAPDSSVLEEFFLEHAVVNHLLERFLEDTHTELFLSTDEAVYVRQPQRPRWDRARAEGQTVLDLLGYEGQGAHKALLFSEQIAGLRHELEGRFPQLNYYGWAGWALEVVAQGGQKGRALEVIAAQLGVPRSEVVAFGDGENDLSMLAWAGRAVGVGSLHDGVAEAIDEHIPGPEALGILGWLERNP